MKKIIFLFVTVAAFVFSCKKDKDPDVYKIRYVVTGEGIEEIKYNAGDVNYSVKKAFANGWDTTFTHTTKQKLHLQAKAKNSNNVNLTGIIYLNDVEVAKQVDESKDTEEKYEVKLEYQIQ